MTYAPQTIRDARALKLRHLDMHPGSDRYPDDLDPAEVGIVGDTAHAAKGTSYHLGKDQLTADAYSRRTARDRAGLTDAASAEDIGEFEVTTPAGTFDLRHFTKWLIAQCRASAPDTLDLREVIGTIDGQTVLRWDAERGRASAPRSGEADRSHLTHTHLSWYRDSETRPKTPLFERYLAAIGLTGDDVDTKQNALLYNASSIAASLARMDASAAVLKNDGTAGTAVELKLVTALKAVASDVTQMKREMAEPLPLEKLAELVAEKLPRPATADEIAAALLRQVLGGQAGGA